MRSAEEIRFRIRQEWRNARLWAKPPALPEAVLRTLWERRRGGAALPGLPAAAEVRPLVAGTRYGEQLQRLAKRIGGGELPLFGQWIRPDGEIRWRRDYRHGRETEAAYLRRVPYLDFARAGDHKWIWEINRHQHLAALAQAWAMEPDAAYTGAIEAQLDSWFAQNPPQRGINWTSALEVAFRALSWVWIWQWAGDGLSEAAARRLLTGLYQHGLHLEANLSIYFSPNTHLLGEALALDALGRLFPEFPEAGRWREVGSREMALGLERQVGADGSYFEQSSYYHVYALDMFLLHRVLAGRGTEAEREKLGRMAEFLRALLGGEGRIALLGDDDGGRLFWPFGERAGFGRGTLAAYGAWAGGPAPAGVEPREAAAEMAVWWMGERAGRWAAEAGAAPAPESRIFRTAGLAVAASGGVQIVADGGPMGPGSAGHSHADALQLVARRDGREVLIDPGTATYVSDIERRNRFRGTAAHNTVTAGEDGDGGRRPDQASAAGPFRWLAPPATETRRWESDSEVDTWEAECRYRNVRHRRMFRFEKAARRMWIADQVEWADGAGEMTLAQHWHLGETPDGVEESTIFCAGARLVLEPGGELTIEKTERSSAFGHWEESRSVELRWRSGSPARRVAMLDWAPGAGAARLSASWDDDGVRIQAQGDSEHAAWQAALRWKKET